MINVWRVKARVESGGHDVPEEKIVTRRPFRIFKKRKQLMYFDECDDWHIEDISTLTGISDMEKKNLN